MAQRIAETKRSAKLRSDSLDSTLVKYALGIGGLLALSIASETFLLTQKTLGPYVLGAFIFVFAFPAGIALVPAFAAKILRFYEHALSSDFVGSLVAQSVFVYLFFDTVFGVALSGASGPIVSMTLFWLTPLIILSEAFILNRFGDIVVGGMANQAVGLVAKRLAVALGVLFFASLLSAFSIWLGYPLIFAAVTYGILSFSPLIAYSKRTENYREAGLYLMRSALPWSVLAFFVGIGAVILTVFQSMIAYAVLLTLGAILVGLVGYKVYSLGATRVAKVNEEIYLKHEHKLIVVRDENFDFLRSSVDKFAQSGKKEDLLIALTTLLANAGESFSESRTLLAKLVGYEVPAIHRLPFMASGMKASLELEVETRIKLINETINLLAQKVGAVKTTS